MVFAYNLTTAIVTLKIIRRFEVVTDTQKSTYNPLTTAYNPKKVTTAFCESMRCITELYEMVVGCKWVPKFLFKS